MRPAATLLGEGGPRRKRARAEELCCSAPAADSEEKRAVAIEHESVPRGTRRKGAVAHVHMSMWVVRVLGAHSRDRAPRAWSGQ